MSDTATAHAPILSEIEAAASRPESRDRAIDMAITALGNGVEAAIVLRLVSEGLEADGRLEDAAALAHRATVVHPADAEAWTRFSRLLRLLGRLDESAGAARAALEIEPGSYAVRMCAAGAFLNVNDFSAAAEQARQGAAQNPLAPEPLSTLAIIHARLSQFAEARDLAERALRLRRNLPGAEITLARVELAEDRADLAISRLRRVLADPNMLAAHRAEALSLLGDALDLAGEPGRAFATYAAGNAVVARQPDAARRRGRRRAVEFAADLERYFQTANPTPWRAGAGGIGAEGDAAGHVFLIGFPRSGTTLLENALASHPGVLALEETDALSRCAGDLMADSAALDRLAHLPGDAADECRAIYWRRASELLNQPVAGKVVVDKMPIATVALPVIVKLFPDSKILMARRDPRDVVLSCFRRLFGVNEVMAEFLSLGEAARYYDQVMRLADLFEDKLALSVHVVRHEDVVADFDSRVAEALTFIGLDWDPAVRAFADRAVKAKTPSATQLSAGLNAKGVGAWRRFGHSLQPILPLLEPWVEKFGYEPTDPALLSPTQDPRLGPLRAAIGQALSAGNWTQVFTRTDEAFAEGLTDPLLHRMRGLRAQQEGRPAEAAADFAAALEDAPGEVGLLSALGLSLARSGRLDEALRRLDEAIALAPTFAAAHFNRGWALEAARDLAGARAAYCRAVEHDPRHAQAMGALAVLASRAADWTQTRELAEQALAVTPGLPSATLAMAAAEAAQSEPASAEARLRALIAGEVGATAHEKAVAHRALGDVLDQMDRPDEAFVAYQAGAADIDRLHRGRFEASRAERTSRIIERLQSWFADADATDWKATPPSDPARPPPIFVLGFPRSGTTLIGQALALHPDLFTLDEADTLGGAVAAFFADRAGLDRLATLDEDRAEPHRNLYWDRAQAAGWPGAERRLVDKAPMNTLALPIIGKLFHGAKILFMRRDPRDVVLSCFRRQFAINPTTIDFLTLEGAAQLYDRTMALFETYYAKLGPDVRIQSHEALVADFEAQGREICDFLDISWNPTMSGISGRAGAVSTPSSAQLAAGVNVEGVGAWRRYKTQLEPVMPILAPWADAFGYPAD